MENAHGGEELEDLQLRDDIQSLLGEAGFTTELLSPLNKDRAIQDILIHRVFKYRREEIQGLREGMDSLHLLNFLCVSEKCIAAVFPLDAELSLTSVDLIAALKHDELDNLTQHQQLVIEWFTKYIKFLEQGKKELCTNFCYFMPLYTTIQM